MELTIGTVLLISGMILYMKGLFRIYLRIYFSIGTVLWACQSNHVFCQLGFFNFEIHR